MNEMTLEAIEHEVAKKYFKDWWNQLDWQSLKDLKVDLKRNHADEEECEKAFDKFFKQLKEEFENEIVA